MKLVVSEAETEALRLEIRDFESLATSRVARVEVGRSARRRSRETGRVAREVLEGFVLLPLDDPVLTAAEKLPPSELRSLDALHVASAISLGDELGTLITYDRRMTRAATAAGLSALAPC